MKIRDILIAIGAVVFSILFYQQWAGINYSLFSILLVVGLAIAQPSVVKNSRWWWCVAAVLFSAISMALYGSTLAFISLILSWLLLSAFTYRPKDSAVLNFAQAGFSVLLSVPHSIRGWFLKGGRNTKKGGINTNHWYIYVLVVVIVIVFIVLYAQASSAFSEVLSKIDLSFISIGWIVTTLLGFIVCTILIRHRRIKHIDLLERKWATPLIALLYQPSPEHTEKQTVERKAGGLLLLLLNIVLLAVNASDIVFLSEGVELNTRTSFSELVHQGVGALIASIVFAVVILLFFFRGQLNFDEKAKTLYFLALLWIAQNLILVATSGIKNSLYIEFFGGLTYKRIGVYYYLLLSIIGLIVTGYKLYAKKPNWFLMRTNFTLFFGILIASSIVNWDSVITNYNMQQAEAKGKDPDIHYMTRLSNHNLIQLVDWAEEAKANPYKTHQLSKSQIENLSDNIAHKTHWFIKDFKSRDWQSWNYQDQKTYNYVKDIKIKQLERPEEIYDYEDINTYE